MALDPRKLDPRQLVPGSLNDGLGAARGFMDEFKAFISRGNVVDLAVGIIIGAAFSGIVKSLVDDVIMPPIGLLLGGVDFSNFFFTLSGPVTQTLEQAKAAGATTLRYGVFINALLNFVIVGFAVFLLVKNVNRFIRKEVAAAPPPPPPKSDLLLEEIRDLLKQQAQTK